MGSEKFTTIMKEGPVCSRNVPESRNSKGSMNKNRASKIAKRILALRSGKNLILSSSNNIKRGFEYSVGESECCSAKSLVQNYGNFGKSGAPSRFMFFCNGLWSDFPESVFGSMREGFVARKSTVEVVMEGLLYLVDFLRMLLIDLETVMHSSIAWIDESGCCFFPEVVVGESEIDREVSANPKLEIELRISNGNGSGGKNSVNLAPELRIPINTDNFFSPMEELAVEVKSNDMTIKKVKLEKIDKGKFLEHPVDVIKCGGSLKRKRYPSDHSKKQIDKSHVNYLQTHKSLRMDRSRNSLESIESSEPDIFTTGLYKKKWPEKVATSSLPAMLLPHIDHENPSKDSQLSFSTQVPGQFALAGKMLAKLKESDKAYMAVKNLFLAGIRRFHPETIISDIYRCSHSGPLGSARLQAFKRHMEMTKAARGNANVRYAWHGTSAKEIAVIVMHGFGLPSRYLGFEAYGVGVYLSPKHSSHISASLSKPDDNGKRHIILCKVIMGNPEHIEPGSGQFQPSSELFDSGVDDLKNPSRYIVWSTHMNRHILPKYVVSFKFPDLLQEPWKTMGLPKNISIGSNMLFPNLLSELEKFLPLSSIRELKYLYTIYKAGRINKDFLIRQVRSIAGDEVLISAIQSIRKQK